MVRHVTHESAAHSPGYTITSALIWVGYAALVIAVISVFAFATPVGVVAGTLAVAAVLYPLRRGAGRLAKRHFLHR